MAVRASGVSTFSIRSYPSLKLKPPLIPCHAEDKPPMIPWPACIAPPPTAPMPSPIADPARLPMPLTA